MVGLAFSFGPGEVLRRHRFHNSSESDAEQQTQSDRGRQISGHSDEKIHERYTHLDVDTKRRALAHLRPLHEAGIS